MVDVPTPGSTLGGGDAGAHEMPAAADVDDEVWLLEELSDAELWTTGCCVAAPATGRLAAQTMKARAAKPMARR